MIQNRTDARSVFAHVIRIIHFMDLSVPLSVLDHPAHITGDIQRKQVRLSLGKMVFHNQQAVKKLQWRGYDKRDPRKSTRFSFYFIRTRRADPREQLLSGISESIPPVSVKMQSMKYYKKDPQLRGPSIIQVFLFFQPFSEFPCFTSSLFSVGTGYQPKEIHGCYNIIDPALHIHEIGHLNTGLIDIADHIL